MDQLSLNPGEHVSIVPAMLSQLPSTRITFTMNENGGVMSTKHAMPEKFISTISLGKNRYKTMPAKGNIPEYIWTRILNVNMNLRNGVRPDHNGKITGLFEIKVNKRTETGKGDMYFLYINVFPTQEQPKYEAVIDENPVNPVSGSYHFGPTMGTDRKVTINLYPVH